MKNFIIENQDEDFHWYVKISGGYFVVGAWALGLIQGVVFTWLLCR